MSSENGITVIAPKSLDEARSLAAIISKSSLLPDAFRGKEAETLMAIMTGAELGLAPMQSLRAIDVIKGKPTLKSETMTALVRARKDVCEYLVIRKSDATGCTYETKRVGDPVATTMSFTVDDARAAGLLTNDNYKRFPAAMLRARCGSAICKAVYSDVTLGLYEPSELGGDTERDVTPSNIIDSTATALPPEDKRATATAAVEAASSVDALNALVPAMAALKLRTDDPLRVRWGQRLKELTPVAPKPSPPTPVEVVNFPEPGAEG